MIRSLTIFVFCLTCTAANLHVSTTGNNGNPGTTNLPKLTITAALAAASSGDTIWIDAGTYTERVAIGTSKTSTLGSPTTFRPYTAARPPNVTWVGGYTVSQGAIQNPSFKDILFNEGSTPDFEGVWQFYHNSSGAALGVGPDITNCWLIGTLNPVTRQVIGLNMDPCTNAAACANGFRMVDCVFSNLTSYAAAIYATNGLVQGNRFDFCNSHDALHVWGANSVYRLNLFTNVSHNPLVADHTDIIQTFGEDPAEAYGIIFERNTIINCEAQIGQLEQGPDTNHWRNIRDWTFRNNLYVDVGLQLNCDLPSTIIENNTLIRCTTNTAHPLIMGYNQKGHATNSVIKNNIFYQCGLDPSNTQFGWYSLDGLTNAGIIADYNFVCGSANAAKQAAPPSDVFHWGAFGTETHGINGGNPLFISATNFKLATNSPLLTLAQFQSAFTNDIVGVDRGGVWDIGAYQTTGFVPPPTPSTNPPIVITGNVTLKGAINLRVAP